MNIYLIRHGIAAPREEYAHDRDRPLTAKGQDRTHQVANQLGSLNLNFDVIVSSPLIRARETAGILMTAGLSDRYEEHEFLAPDGKITDFWTWLQPQLPLEAIALVGHQPDLGHWAELLVWGKVQEKIILKKAGIIGIKMPHTTKSWQGTGDLLTLISPKWILT